MRIIKLGLCLLFAVMSPLYSGAQNIYTWQDFAGAFSLLTNGAFDSHGNIYYAIDGERGFGQQIVTVAASSGSSVSYAGEFAGSAWSKIIANHTKQ